MSQIEQEQIDDGNDEDIRSIEGSEWTLETTSIDIDSTIGDGNEPAEGKEGNSTNAMLLLLETKVPLEKLKKAEQKANSIIQEIQEKIDETAKGMATRNAEYQKRKQELEEKCQKEIAELKAKNMQENENFAKQMDNLKEQLKEKIEWNQVDLLVMGTKLDSPISNPFGNGWTKTRNGISTSMDGLYATNDSNLPKWQSVCAEKGFHISADYPGTLLYYFEVTNMSWNKQHILVGLSSGNTPDGSTVGVLANSYAIQDGIDHCCMSGKPHAFEWPNGAIKPLWKGKGDVVGCGLVQNPENGLAIFFTGNGILMGTQIPIHSTVNTLYPTVSIFGKGNVSVEVNFGNDSAKPFKYDIKKCAGGMVFK